MMCIVYETDEAGTNSACYAFLDPQNILYGSEVRYCIPEGSALGREKFSTTVISINEDTMSSWEAYPDGCNSYDSSQPIPEEEEEVVEEEVVEEEVVEEEEVTEEGDATDDAADDATDDESGNLITYLALAGGVGLILLFVGIVVTVIVLEVV